MANNKFEAYEATNPLGMSSHSAKRYKDSMVLFASEGDVSQITLDSLNVEQARGANKESLDALGGVEGLVKRLNVNVSSGLTSSQVDVMRKKYGTNVFPESPIKGLLELFFESFQDLIVMILIGAALVSLVVGLFEDPHTGWIEGTAILMAVFIVACVTAGNNYSKELQFRALEKSSQRDDRCSVLRDKQFHRINPDDLVVGDIVVLQAGDSVPADCIIIDDFAVSSNESSLTGEPEDIKKRKDGDPFLLSSCLVTEAEDKVKCVVIGIGTHSQWGKIKANLVTETSNTPLQDKLEDMAGLIGYIGMGASLSTFIALVASIWLRHHGHHVLDHFIESFIIAVTIIVVAIPEGLPLAVTLSLAYSTTKMYQDQCFIRVLAACETMGNATNLCSDKTGTLTENRMTVVEAWIGDKKYNQTEFANCSVDTSIKQMVCENACINRVAYLTHTDNNGVPLNRPIVIGNKTEGALLVMAFDWGYECEEVKSTLFNEHRDKIFSFNSNKKRSTALIHRSDGSVRLYVKGAPEWILADCTAYTQSSGSPAPMTTSKKHEIENYISQMSNNARRTLCLAHKDFTSASQLPSNWKESPPDNSSLVCDCVVGIIDPLRSDVHEAVVTAQRAGVTVRMVTGDNIHTASAIAKQCGILTEGGMALEGPAFRNMTPAQVDAVLPKLQVLARSSPEDKFLLVTRLNGYGLPSTEEEWYEKHKDKPGISWIRDRDRLLPGYKEEWERTRTDGGEVVGVTGDGTNDAPALKAADVGLAMGITGTKVAQSASDIVILDDKFSSIVRAIMWGRSVYDNIRKFLQFQLTVNVVALTIVFVGAVAGFDPPLNTVMMLWVNLIMDTMGALALGTEQPTQALLQRRPYKRTAPLISKPMWRNIVCQAILQVSMLLFLLFKGYEYFGVNKGDWCSQWDAPDVNAVVSWDPQTGDLYNNLQHEINCASFNYYCNDHDGECYDAFHTSPKGFSFSFDELNGFNSKCSVECVQKSYVHTTIIFNAFVFCQLFNEFNARNLFDELNMFSGLQHNPIFILVLFITVICQYIIVTFGGEFTRTSPLTQEQWLATILFGLSAFPVGLLMRFIPVKEDENDFFYDTTGISNAFNDSGSFKGKQHSGYGQVDMSENGRISLSSHSLGIHNGVEMTANGHPL